MTHLAAVVIGFSLAQELEPQVPLVLHLPGDPLLRLPSQQHPDVAKHHRHDLVRGPQARHRQVDRHDETAEAAQGDVDACGERIRQTTCL